MGIRCTTCGAGWAACSRSAPASTPSSLVARPRAIALVPPMLREGLPMPVAAVRRWLTSGRPGDQWSDLGSSADDDIVGQLAERPVLRWRGAEDCSVVPARGIRPGDTLVLPASYGPHSVSATGQPENDALV